MFRGSDDSPEINPRTSEFLVSATKLVICSISFLILKTSQPLSKKWVPRKLFTLQHRAFSTWSVKLHIWYVLFNFNVTPQDLQKTFFGDTTKKVSPVLTANSKGEADVFLITL